MSETIEESYNRVLDAYDALKEAVMEMCDIDTQREIIRRKKEILSKEDYIKEERR